MRMLCVLHIKDVITRHLRDFYHCNETFLIYIIYNVNSTKKCYLYCIKCHVQDRQCYIHESVVRFSNDRKFSQSP